MGGAGNAGRSEEGKAANHWQITKLQLWAAELNATRDFGK